jgi:phage-related protein
VALVKTVELRILASAADAQRQIDDIAAKAKELDSDAVHVRFRVDADRAKAQLDEMRAKAMEAGFRDVSIKVRVDGAGRAIADLRAVKHEEDAVRGPGLFRGLLGSLLTGSRTGGGTGGLFGAVESVPGSVGPVPLAALPAVAAGAAAALTEVTALATGFAAAGAGAAAFAALALPAVKQVQSAYQGLGKAQAAYQQAQAKEAADPTKANAKAVQAAALNLKLAQEQIAKLPASERAAVTGIQHLSTEFGKMSRAFAPQAFKVFADGLKVVGNLLPHLTQFATPFAGALDGLFKKLDKFTQSKGFQQFMAQMASLVGPATTAIGEGVGKIGTAFGHLLTIMSRKDVVHGINTAFDLVAGAVNVVTGAVQHAMSAWDQFTRNMHGIAGTFDNVRHGIADMGHTVAHAFDGLRHFNASVFSGIKAAAVSAAHGVASAFKSMASGVASAVSAVIQVVHTMAHDIASGVSAAVQAVSKLPGEIKGFFDGARGWLLAAGRNIIQGLIDGIGSMIGAVGSAIGSIVSKIRSFLPFSPAKEGPLSGAGSPDRAGAKIAAMLAAGMDSGAGGVSRAAGRLAGAAAVSPAMAGYGGGGITVNIHTLQGGQEVARHVHQMLRDYKRKGGGAALGLG